MTDTRNRHKEHQHVAPQSLTYIRVIEEVIRTGITQSELGKVVGAGTRSVQNWANGQNAPRGKSVTRLLDLHSIVTVLADTYTDEGIDIWLRARNRNLDMQRPIDLLTAGHFDEVLAEARWVAGGM